MAYDPTIQSTQGVAKSFALTASAVTQGDIAVINTSGGSQGYAQPGAQNTDNQKMLGLFTESVDNSGGSAGDLSAEVEIGRQEFIGMTVTGSGGSGAIVPADIGKKLYVDGVRAFTVVAPTHAVEAGTLIGYEGDGTTKKGHVLFDGLGQTLAAS